MTAKKKHVQKLLTKLRDGSQLAPTFQEAINTLVIEKDDPPLGDFEARGGNLDHLKGDALYAYLDLQSGKQRRQLEQNTIELEETVYRINQLLDNHGFLPYTQPEASPQQEHDSHFFHVIKEAKVQEQGVLSAIFEYIELHMAKAKQQYDAMKEIEQWFLDMLNDKGLENEFNNELLSIRQRHREQVVSDEAVEDTLRRVQQTGHKLKEIGDILILTSPDGVKVFDGPPPDPENTCTLLVPNEDNSDTRFVFTVILDDELMFREEKIQMLAQQYLKGMIFYGSAARHKNRAQKRKVIRLMMGQLEAIYNFIKRLRAAVFGAQGDASNQKARADDMAAQKEQAYKDRDRYRGQVDDADQSLKKAMGEADTLRLQKTMLEATLKEFQQERDSLASTSSRHKSGLDAVHHESHSNHPSNANIIGLPPRKGIRPTGPRIHVEFDGAEAGGPSTAELGVVEGPKEAVSREHGGSHKKDRKRGAQPEHETQLTHGHEDPVGSKVTENMPSEGKTRQLGEVQSTGSEGVQDEAEASAASREGRPGETRSRERTPRKAISREKRKEADVVSSREDHFPPAVTSRDMKNEETVDNEVDSTEQQDGSSADTPKKAHRSTKSRRASRHRVRASVDKGRRGSLQESEQKDPIEMQDEGVDGREYREDSDASQTQRDSDVSEVTETMDGSMECPPCPACPPPPLPPVTADQEVQFGVAADQKAGGVNKTTAAQRSLIKVQDVEAQPSFTGLTPEEQAVYEETMDKVTSYEEQVEQLTNELDELRSDHEESETRAHDAEVLLRSVETKATTLEADNIAMKHLVEKTEAEKDQLVTWAHDIETENEQTQATLANLEATVAQQKKLLDSYQRDTKSLSVTTEGDIFGFSVQMQTDEMTSGEAKTELQKLKSALADFRRSMIGVLISQNLIADIPSFPEQLRDTWNAASGAAEIVQDVKEHFSVLTDVIAQGFEHREAEHRAAFQALAQKKATEFEKTVTGTDSSEDMRKVRLKLRQRVLELEVEANQMHDVLKTMTKLLEDKRASYEGQLSQKEDNLKKQREEIRKMKDLAWTLAESLAKLRDEGIARMPERKSLADMMQLLQAVEQKVGKKLRTQERRTVAPQMLVTGDRLFDPNASQTKVKSDSTEGGAHMAHQQRSIDGTAQSYGLNVVGLSRAGLPGEASKEVLDIPSAEVPSTHSAECSDRQVETFDRGVSTSDRISRAMMEITHFYLDPHNDWVVRSATREVAFGHKIVQTGDNPNDALIAQLDENGQPLPTDGVLFDPSRTKGHYNTPLGDARDYEEPSTSWRKTTGKDVTRRMVGHIGLIPGAELAPPGSGYASSPAMIHSFDKFVPHHGGPITEASYSHFGQQPNMEQNIAALPGFDTRHQLEAAASHIGSTVHGLFRDLAARDPHEVLHEHLMQRSSFQRRSSAEMRTEHRSKNLREDGLKAIMGHCEDCDLSASRHSLVKTAAHPRPLQTGISQMEDQVHTGGHYYLAGSPPYYATPAFVQLPKEPGSPAGMSGPVYTIPRVPVSQHAAQQRAAAQAAMDDAESILADLEKRLLQQVQDVRHANASKEGSQITVDYEDTDEVMPLASKASTRVAGAESLLLEEVHKIRRARGRVSEVRVRLTMLENEAQYPPPPPPLAVHQRPRTEYNDSKPRRHSMETLRQETKMIKDDIRALVRGHKRLASSNRRRSAEDAEDQERRQRRLVELDGMEQERDRQMAQDKASRRKKINSIDQMITKFVQPEAELQEKSLQSPLSIQAQFSNSDGPRSPLRMEGIGSKKPEQEGQIQNTPRAKYEKSQFKRTDFTDETTLPNESISEKLRRLNEERMAQAPRYLERMPDNPLIRTPRGLEPLEGPVDLVPYNFPEMGVIGRPLQPKTRKGSELKWVPADSTAPSEPAPEVNFASEAANTTAESPNSVQRQQDTL